MFNMSSQDTRRKVRLNEKVESRVRGDLYARFGGECLETCYCQRWQGAGCLAYGQQVDGAQRLAQFIRNGTIGRFRAYTANQPSTLQQGKEDRNIPESAIGRIRRTRYAGITVIDVTKHPDSLLG